MSLERMEQIIQESTADVVSKTEDKVPETKEGKQVIDESVDNSNETEVDEAEQEAVNDNGEEEDDNELEQDTDEPESDELDDEENKDDFEPFPKKASNVISRKNEKINELRGKFAESQARIEQLEQRLASQTTEQQAGKSDGLDNFGLKEPVETDFDDYGDFLEAKGEYKAELRYKQNEMKNAQENEIKIQQQYVSDRVNNINSKADELIKTVPELTNLYKNNENLIKSLPDHVKSAFLEADNTPLAFYALVQEDKLESLAGMSPMQAAAEIGRAQERGERIVAARRQTKAPSPATKLKTRAIKTKSADDMTPSELVAHLQTLKKR